MARDTVSKTRMIIQLTLISMSIPAILPIRNEPGIEILLFTNVYNCTEVGLAIVCALHLFPSNYAQALLSSSYSGSVMRSVTKTVKRDRKEHCSMKEEKMHFRWSVSIYEALRSCSLHK